LNPAQLEASNSSNLQGRGMAIDNTVGGDQTVFHV
jgi:hypothetical protein